MKVKTLINPSLPTIPGTFVVPGISSPVRVLAKVEEGIPSALRYGNRSQAEAKIKNILPQLAEKGNTATVVQVESRFLIAIFPAEYDFDQKSGKLASKLAAKARCDARRPPFATVSGPRINPRNRHNQNGAGPVYCA